MTKPLESVIKSYVDACVSWDYEAVISYFDDDITFCFPGTSELAGTYVGKKRVLELIEEIFRLTGGEINFIRDILVGDEHVSVLVNERLTREGRPSLDVERVVVYRVKNGKFVEGRTYFSRLEDFDAYLAAS
jgi:ketosteroid isomerase-like protein